MSDIEDTDKYDDDRAARIADLDDDEPCEVCGHLPCGCAPDEPDVTTALGFEGRCEACHELVQVDQRVRVYADDVVVHERCPRPRAQA